MSTVDDLIPGRRDPHDQVPAPAPAELGAWRPAVFSELRHRVAALPVVRFRGDPVVRARCGGTAHYDGNARGGPPRWAGWRPCPACLADERP